MAADQNAAEVMPQLQLDSQLCFPLYAASRKVVNHYTPFLKPFGITYTQYIVLLALWEVKTSTVGELCDRLYLDNGTVTPLLKKMEEVDSDVGKVSLTITITKDKIPVTTEKDYRDADVPKLKWKAESNVPMKNAFEGEFGGEYELTKEDGSYGLKSISGQTSMFDEEDEDLEDEE